jgi:hypothetical protein
MPPTRPAPIRTDGSNAFAHRSMKERIPRILQEVVDRNPDYPPSVQDAIQALREAIADDLPLTLFDPPAPDYDLWKQRYAPHEGETWLGTEWLFAETFAYRKLLAACRYWTTRRDPFQPVKQDELTSDALQTAVEQALAREGDRREALQRALIGALWGNRVDLSMKGVLAQGTAAGDEHLLVNDIPAAVDDLLRGAPGAVHLIMDNAGTEEALDLVLADRLLDTETARRVVLHVKMTPVLVSDVLGEDVFRLLDVLDAQGGRPAALAKRCRTYVDQGRLEIVPDPFWSTDGRLQALPPRLKHTFRGAALIVAKGDANYRRTTNDAVWPADATWEAAARGAPTPLLALRTIKSDPLVGVAPETVRRLDAEAPDWRTTGTYGVAQYAR